MEKKAALEEAVLCCMDKAAFLFDMDGVIFDTERLFMEQLAVVMRERGYILTREKYGQTLGLGGDVLREKMASLYGKEYPFDELGAGAAKRAAVIAETVGLTVKPGIRKVLECLRERRRPCAVASSTKTTVVEKYLSLSRLEQYFQEITGGDQVARSKPEPDIFLLTAEKLGVRAEDCVVVEDSEKGVLAALAAGCTVICVPDLQTPQDDVLRRVHYVVGTPVTPPSSV